MVLLPVKSIGIRGPANKNTNKKGWKVGYINMSIYFLLELFIISTLYLVKLQLMIICIIDSLVYYHFNESVVF